MADLTDNPPADPNMDFSRQLGGYTLIREVGRGAMGEVWLARDSRLDRLVAIKMMRCEIADDPSYIQRFQREARAVAKLAHPHIVQIYAIGEEEDTMYFAMEWVDGQTLASKIRETGALPRKEALRIMMQAADALDYACSLGVIHRDIKPGNIMLDSSGRVKIADFGLAKLADVETQMTRTGTPLGSPNYMSPEACRGEELDHRSDIYSLGVTFYQMLKGELPYSASSPMSVMYMQVNEPLPEPQVLRMLDNGIWMDLLHRMLAKSRDDRFRTYTELREALAQVNSASTGVAPLKAPSPGPLLHSHSVTPFSATFTPGSGSVTLQRPAPPPMPQRQWLPLFGKLALGVLGLVFLAGAALLMMDWIDERQSRRRSASPIAAAPPPAATQPLPSPAPPQPAPASITPAPPDAALPPPDPMAHPPLPSGVALDQVLQNLSPQMLASYRNYDLETLSVQVADALNSPALPADIRGHLQNAFPYLQEVKSLRSTIVATVQARPGYENITHPRHGELTVVGGDAGGLQFRTSGNNVVRLAWNELTPGNLVILGRPIWGHFQGRQKTDALIYLYPGLREMLHSLPPPGGPRGGGFGGPGGQGRPGGPAGPGGPAYHQGQGIRPPGPQGHSNMPPMGGPPPRGR